MKISDLLLMALRNLIRRKLRALLTILGVLIGTTSIVVMISIGLGLDYAFTKSAEENGSLNTIEVMPSWENTNTRRRNQEWQEPVITQEDLKKILKDPNIIAVSPFESANVQVKYDKYRMWGDVYAVEPSALGLFDIEVDRGRMITNKDKLQVVVGSRLSERLYDENARGRRKFGDDSPDVDFLDQKLDFSISRYNRGTKKPKFYQFEVVGVLKKGGWQTDMAIYVNAAYWSEFMEKLERKYDREEYKKNRNKKKGYNQVKAYMKDMKVADETVKRLEEAGFEAYTQAVWINEEKKRLAIIQAVLGGIGAVSLFVAAIGITNTMIMSIYERTKEIGVMKVIGANLRDIRRIFLLEAAAIGFWGGVVGIGLSFGLSKIINIYAVEFVSQYGDDIQLSIIPLWLVGVAIVFSTLIGLTSGFLPALRAMKLSALNAIRTE